MGAPVALQGGERPSTAHLRQRQVLVQVQVGAALEHHHRVPGVGEVQRAAVGKAGGRAGERGGGGRVGLVDGAAGMARTQRRVMAVLCASTQRARLGEGRGWACGFRTHRSRATYFWKIGLPMVSGGSTTKNCSEARCSATSRRPSPEPTCKAGGRAGGARQVHVDGGAVASSGQAATGPIPLPACTGLQRLPAVGCAAAGRHPALHRAEGGRAMAVRCRAVP